MELFTVENIIAFFTLAGLEIVLGIDNMVVITIITERLPKHQRVLASRLGLSLAMFERIGLLFLLSWLIKLNEPLFHFLNQSFSGRDLILLAGGMFLIAKSTHEMHSEVVNMSHSEKSPERKVSTTFFMAIVQIILLDTVFSLDSVITAVGMVKIIEIMVAAIVVAVIVMMLLTKVIQDFIINNPAIKILALSFLLLIGVFLVAEGLGQHIEKGYIYFAMGFSMFIEFVNSRMRKQSKP